MAPIDSPTQITKAFILLWLSFGISLLEGLATQVVSASADDDLGALAWVISVAVFAVSAYFIYCASRRRNWARIVLLVLTFVAVAAYLVWPPLWSEDPWWSTALFCVSAIMDTVALFWLFTGEGAKWYAVQRA